MSHAPNTLYESGMTQEFLIVPVLGLLLILGYMTHSYCNDSCLTILTLVISVKATQCYTWDPDVPMTPFDSMSLAGESVVSELLVICIILSFFSLLFSFSLLLNCN